MARYSDYRGWEMLTESIGPIGPWRATGKRGRVRIDAAWYYWERNALRFLKREIDDREAGRAARKEAK